MRRTFRAAARTNMHCAHNFCRGPASLRHTSSCSIGAISVCSGLLPQSSHLNVWSTLLTLCFPTDPSFERYRTSPDAKRCDGREDRRRIELVSRYCAMSRTNLPTLTSRRRHLRTRSVISFSAKRYFLTGSAAKTQCRSIRPLT